MVPATTSTADPARARPADDTYWVAPGSLLAGAYPGAKSRSQAMHRLGRFLDAGITCFVDLTQPGEIRSYESLLPSDAATGRRVVYRRMPIVDHGVPPDRETMARILDAIDEAIAAGHVVYLHCRAGVGRSAMAAACWLGERAGGGEQGLHELAAIWPQAAQSQHWPWVPETEAQERFVRDWPGRAAVAARQARSGPTAAAEPTFERRLLGSWLGLALGDAIGAADGAGQHAVSGRLEWTQHTALALCAAESLCAADGFDARDQILRFIRWQKEGHLSASGVPEEGRASADVAKALATFLWRGLPMAGSHDPADRAPTSLPRVLAAVAFRCDDAAAAVALAAECSRITHQSPLILDACRVYAGMLVGALRGDPPDTWLAGLPAAAATAFGARPVPKPIRAIFAPSGAATTAASGHRGVTEVLGDVRRVVGTAGDFSAIVAAATARGGAQHAALHGALAGTLFGALHGVDAIPGELRSRLVGVSQVLQIAEQCVARLRDRGVLA